MEDWGAVRDRCARDIERVGDWDGADHYEDCPAIPHVDHECDCPVIENDDDDTADECAARCEDMAESVCDCYLGVMRALRADIRAALERVAALERQVADEAWIDNLEREAKALRQRVEELEQNHQIDARDQNTLCCERNEAVARAEAAEAKLAVWEKAESLPDCPACAALAAAKGE